MSAFGCVYGTKVQLDIASRESIMYSGLRVSAFALSVRSGLRCDDFFCGADRTSTDGSQWDHLFANGERFAVGEMEGCVLLCPGHTLCSVTYVIGNAAFVHDTIFMPDSGTARADFPGGDARQLWKSIQRILQLPPDTRLFTGHDYRPKGREPQWESTIAAQKAHNLHLKGFDEAKFVKLRQERDRRLPMPTLMLPALQVNIMGGRLPAPEDNGRRYLKIPLNAFPQAPWDDLGSVCK